MPLSRYIAFLLVGALVGVWLLTAAPAAADAEQSQTSEDKDKAEPVKAAAIDPSDFNVGGAGDLLIAPTRVVLEGRTRAAEITLHNKGAKEATYRVSFAHVTMDDNGRYTELKDQAAQNKALRFADELLRYSPHQVTLKPGESQVVKVMVRPSEGLAEGEYCSHLLFRAVPDASAGEDVEATKVQDGKITIHLVPIYGVSIPVIVRHGTLSAQARVSNVRLSGRNLLLTLTRSGTASVYGDVIATEAGSDTVVGQLRGVAVLATNDRRNVSMPLTAQAHGTLTVEYRQRVEDGGKVLDKTSIAL